MAPLSPAVAAVRAAVRASLAALVNDPSGAASGLVMVACSGGADSLALAEAVGFVAPRLGLRCGLVTVDHQLQPGSADRAEAVKRWADERGFAPVHAVRVAVSGRGGGPEAAARSARYEALATVSERAGAEAVVLGHTRDDQAETVLLALARGAGPRGMAGMPPVRSINGTRFLRPLLDVSRAQTRAVCVELGLEPWDDPHNTDPAYTRARVRSALPQLVAVLGEGLVANLARTAQLLAADLDFLDAATETASATAASGGEGLSVPALADLPAALRRRVIHRWARSCASGAELSHRHVEALEALVTRWRGQGPVALPGGVLAGRVSGRLVPLKCGSEKKRPRRSGDHGHTAGLGACPRPPGMPPTSSA